MRDLVFKIRFVGLVALATVPGVWPMAAQASGGLGLGKRPWEVEDQGQGQVIA